MGGPDPLIALAVVALWLSQIADARFRETVASAFRFDLREWSATITPRWFDGGSVPSACAVLAGIAIGAGFGARRESFDAEAEAP